MNIAKNQPNKLKSAAAPGRKPVSYWKHRCHDDPCPVPLWFRIPAWLLLFAFWVFLAYTQYKQP